QRRAMMRKPFATRKAAPRLSADRPVRKATWRSGSGSPFGGFGLRPGARKLLSAIAVVLREFECALVDLAARTAGGERDFADGVLHRHARERIAQQLVHVERAAVVFRRRTDDDDDLAARLGALRVGVCERLEIAAADFFVQLRKLAADGGRTRAETR